MRPVRRKGPIVVGALFLGLAGIGLGMAASSVTSASVTWRPPARFAATESMPAEPVDQGEAGRSWARVAYDGGLRRCPEMNADFVAACQAEMKALAERPAMIPGSYGGPLLITKVEPTPEPPVETYRPEPLPEPALVSAAYETGASALPPMPEPTPDNYPAAPLPN